MSGPEASDYGTIVIVGGGCYGSYYVRQLDRAREAGAISFEKVLVVDHSAECAVAAIESDAEIVIAEWTDFFDDYLGSAPEDNRDAIVPSPLMPHLMYQWLLRQARFTLRATKSRGIGGVWERFRRAAQLVRGDAREISHAGQSVTMRF